VVNGCPQQQAMCQATRGLEGTLVMA